MENVRQEITSLVETIIQPNTAHHTTAIGRCFAPDAVLNHPFFVLKGRDRLMDLFSAWSNANSRMSVTVHDVIYDEELDKVVVDLTQHLRPKLFAGLLPVDFRMLVELYLKDVDDSPQTERIRSTLLTTTTKQETPSEIQIPSEAQRKAEKRVKAAIQRGTAAAAGGAVSSAVADRGKERVELDEEQAEEEPTESEEERKHEERLQRDHMHRVDPDLEAAIQLGKVPYVTQRRPESPETEEAGRESGGRGRGSRARRRRSRAKAAAAAAAAESFESTEAWVLREKLEYQQQVESAIAEGMGLGNYSPMTKLRVSRMVAAAEAAAQAMQTSVPEEYIGSTSGSTLSWTRAAAPSTRAMTRSQAAVAPVAAADALKASGSKKKRKVIVRQDDIYTVQGIVRMSPISRWLYDVVVLYLGTMILGFILAILFGPRGRKART